MDMLGIDPTAITAPVRTGLIVAGQYRGENGIGVSFTEDSLGLSGCGKLVESGRRYTITKKGNTFFIQVTNDPHAFALVLELDANITGPGPTDIQDQIITGYHNNTIVERRVSDNQIVGERPVSEPIYAPKLERCTLGALRSTGPIVSARLLPALTAVATGQQDTQKVKTTSAGRACRGVIKVPVG